MMSDFKFLKNDKTWVILAPRRAKRPDEIEKKNLECPFENPPEDQILQKYDDILVLKNKFPFAPIHEIVVHSSDHHKNFDEQPEEQIGKIFKVFRERFNLHKKSGNVTIFNNFGLDAGASVAHPHSQIAVTPLEVNLDVMKIVGTKNESVFQIPQSSFVIQCPQASQWPDETWIIPKDFSGTFGDLNDPDLKDLAIILRKIIKLLDMRHGEDFSYNFYISPLDTFYLRIIPRQKKIGGFELATNIFVNTQNPEETLEFIKENWELSTDQIAPDSKANYVVGV